MPPKRASSRARAKRVIPYDLRRTHIPHVSPPPPAGKKRDDCYTPAVAAKEIGRIKNEGKKKGYALPGRRKPAPSREMAPGPAPKREPRLSHPESRESSALNRHSRRSAPESSPLLSLTPSIRSSQRRRGSPPESSPLLPPPLPTRSSQRQPAQQGLPQKRVRFRNTAVEPQGGFNDDIMEEGSPSSDLNSDPPGFRAASDPEDEEEEVAQRLFMTKEKYKDMVARRKISAARREYAEAKEAYGDGGLATSELGEELEEAMQNSDFTIRVHYLVRMNGKLIVRKILEDTTRRTFDVADLEEEIGIQVERSLKTADYEILSRTVNIKHESGRSGVDRQDLDSFSAHEAEEVLQLVEEKRANHRKGVMVMIFEVSVKLLPRIESTPTSTTPAAAGGGFVPPDVSPGKNGRVSRLQEQHQVRVETLRTVGDFQGQLMERYRCQEDNCTNRNNFCFVDPVERTKHYNMTVAQQEAWASAMSRGEATLLNPPSKLYRYWVQEQGGITRNSREPTKVSATRETRFSIDRLMDMQEKMQEQIMQSRMMDHMDQLQERQERRDDRNEVRLQRERDRHHEEQRVSALPAFSRQPRAHLPVAYLPASDRMSSPIDGIEDDADVLDHFFLWKMANTRDVGRREKWERVHTVVRSNDWYIKDIKAMEVPDSDMYRRAIQAGLTDGIARGLRGELRSFKPVYRRLKDQAVRGI